MKLFVPTLLLCLLLTGCLKTPGKSGWNTATGAEQYERLMWQAIHDKQWDEMEHHLAATFVGVNSKGQKFDRAGWVEYWKARPAVEASLGELSVQPEGADMVVSYVANLSGASSSSGMQVVSVWQQLKGGWVLISQAITPVISN
ncbi:MAG TPA: nuclear transport factor 2 family protein [Candidatus Angelobacter sp.]